MPEKFKKLTINAAKKFYNENKSPKIYMDYNDGYDISESNYIGKCTFTGDLFAKKRNYILKNKEKIIKNWLSTAKGPYLGKTDGRMIYGLGTIIDEEQWIWQVCFRPKNVLSNNCLSGGTVYYKTD